MIAHRSSTPSLSLVEAFATGTILAALLAPVADAADLSVTITGTVEYNQVQTGPFAAVAANDLILLSLVVSTDQFANSANFPRRRYTITPTSFSLRMGTVEATLATGGKAYFVIRNNDPAVDGFFLSQGLELPTPLALTTQGVFGPFGIAVSVTYENEPLSSLSIDRARGEYDFEELSVFSLGVADGPFDPIGMIFTDMQIRPLGCRGDLDDGSGTGTPDGAVTIDDLLSFLTTFEEGC